MPTDPNEYNFPAIDLPDLWRYAVNDKGRIYYYHAKILIPQWEPPIKLLPLMEEQTLTEVDIKMEPIDMDDEAENDNDPDDEDEDVVDILSNSKINGKKLLTLKSDPTLEKYNDDDDSSSTDSDDSVTQDLEMRLSYIREKMAAHWGKATFLCFEQLQYLNWYLKLILLLQTIWKIHLIYTKK